MRRSGVADAEVPRPLRARVRRRNRDERQPRLGGRRASRCRSSSRRRARARPPRRRRRSRVRRQLAPAAGDVDRSVPALGREQERPLDPPQHLRQRVEPPADDHASRSRARSRNACAARVSDRPGARARKMSRAGSSPSTRASASVPAASAGLDRRARDERDAVARLDRACAPTPAGRARAARRSRAAARPRSRSSSSIASRTPAPSCIRISALAAQVVERDRLPRERGGPGGHARTTWSRKSGSNTTERWRRAKPTTPSSSARSATSSTIAMRVGDGERDAQLRVRTRELAEEDGDDRAAGPGRRAELEPCPRSRSPSASSSRAAPRRRARAARCGRAAARPRSARRGGPSGRASCTPSRFSSARICRLTAGCVTPSRSAACEKLFFSTTAQKAASCRVSIRIHYGGRAEGADRNALASIRGVADAAVRVVRRALRDARGDVDEAARRPRAADPRRRLRAPLRHRRAAARARHRGASSPTTCGFPVLYRGERVGRGGPHVHDPQVPHAEARRRDAARPVPRRGARASAPSSSTRRSAAG